MRWRAAYWLCVLAGLAVYAAMVFWTLPAIAQAAGGLSAFDLRPFGYSEAEARAFLTALSAEGRALYTGPQRWLDLLYPALLGLSLAGPVLWLVASRPWRVVFISVIVAATALDYLENYLVAGLLAGDIDARAISAASRATMVKSALDSCAILIVLAVSIRAALRKGKNRP
jgi:hypothetical protein